LYNRKIEFLSSEDKKLILTLESDRQKIINPFPNAWLNKALTSLEKLSLFLGKKIRFLKLKLKKNLLKTTQNLHL